MLARVGVRDYKVFGCAWNVTQGDVPRGKTLHVRRMRSKAA
jgi:hypothetical protein